MKNSHCTWCHEGRCKDHDYYFRYRVKYFDAQLSRKGKGVQIKGFKNRKDAEEFASHNILHAKPCLVMDIGEGT